MGEDVPAVGSTVDNAHMMEIAKIAMTAGAIESSLAGIATILIDPAGAVGSAVLGNSQFSATADLVKRVLPARIEAVGLSPDEGLGEVIQSCILNWISDARTVMKSRNGYLHADWILTPGTQEVIILRRNAAVQGVAIHDMRADVAKAVAVSLRGGQLHTLLMGQLGLLDALYEASKEMSPEWFEEQERLNAERGRTAEQVWLDADSWLGEGHDVTVAVPDTFCITYTGNPAFAGLVAQLLREEGLDPEWNPPEERRGGLQEIEVGVAVFYIVKVSDAALAPIIARVRAKLANHGTVEYEPRHKAE